MKRKSIFICTLIILTIFMFACCGTGNEAEVETEIVVNEIEHEIVFIINKQEFSDDYINNGYFIDNLGNRCYFDLSSESINYADIKYLYKYLNENIEEYEKEPYLEKNQLYEAYKHLLMIDDNAEIKEVCTGSADVGSLCYFGVRPDKDGEMEIILLEEYGDWEVTNLDKNVDDIMEIIGRDNWERDIWERSNHYTD